MTTKLAIGLSGQDMIPLEVVECCKLADSLGYHSFWLSEGHGGDQFTTLTACALATDNIKLGTIHNQRLRPQRPHHRHGRRMPRPLLQRPLYPGPRFQPQGPGRGRARHPLPPPRHPTPRVHRRHPLPPPRRQSLLQGQSPRHPGNFDLWFPTLHPEVPIYAAAVFDKMLRTCGEITDGTILTWTTLSGAANAAKTVAERRKSRWSGPLRE